MYLIVAINLDPTCYPVISPAQIVFLHHVRSYSSRNEDGISLAPEIRGLVRIPNEKECSLMMNFLFSFSRQRYIMKYEELWI